MTEIVQVLTRKSLADILARGGTGDWRANRDRLEGCEYVMMYRNTPTGWPDSKKPFLIAQVEDVERADGTDHRWVIKFSTYAHLEGNETGPWDGRRNPSRVIKLCNDGPMMRAVSSSNF